MEILITLRKFKKISFLFIFLLVVGMFPAGVLSTAFGGGGKSAAYAASPPISTPADAPDYMMAYSLAGKGRAIAKFQNGYADAAYVYRSALVMKEKSLLGLSMPRAGALNIKIYSYDSADLGLTPTFPDLRAQPLNVNKINPLPQADFVPPWNTITAAKPLGYL